MSRIITARIIAASVVYGSECMVIEIEIKGAGE